MEAFDMLGKNLTRWLAGFTLRWHTNPQLRHTFDPVDGHEARVAKLMISLWPDTSREALIWALIHDDGESVTGDIPAMHEADKSAEADALTRIWGRKQWTLFSEERDRLKFCDKLDAHLWAMHHKPHLAENDDWQEALDRLQDMAATLGVTDGLNEMIEGVKG